MIVFTVYPPTAIGYREYFTVMPSVGYGRVFISLDFNGLVMGAGLIPKLKSAYCGAAKFSPFVMVNKNRTKN